MSERAWAAIYIGENWSHDEATLSNYLRQIAPTHTIRLVIHEGGDRIEDSIRKVLPESHITIRAVQSIMRQTEVSPGDETLVDEIVDLLRARSYDESTPIGIRYFDIMMVPIRRFVRRLIQQILRLTIWDELSETDHLFFVPNRIQVIEPISNTSKGYAFDGLSVPGILYLTKHVVGTTVDCPSAERADALQAPKARDHVCDLEYSHCDVAFLSWTSRHVGTFLPVIEELHKLGIRSLVLDGAKSSKDQLVVENGAVQRIGFSGIFSSQLNSGVRFRNPHSQLGGSYKLRDNVSVDIRKLTDVVRQVSMWWYGTIFTPSLQESIEFEQFVCESLKSSQVKCLVCANDTSPVGYETVRIARALGVRTIYVQHGAIVPDEVSWKSFQCESISLMGLEDVEKVQGWHRDSNARILVLGQPRFDQICHIDRTKARNSILRLFQERRNETPRRIMLLTPQPTAASRSFAQLNATLQALAQMSDTSWGLIIAVHPAQDTDLYQRWLNLWIQRHGNVNALLSVEAIPFQEYVVASDVMITHYSTSALEAVIAGVPVIEMSFLGSESLHLHEYKVGLAASSPADIVSCINMVTDTSGHFLRHYDHNRAKYIGRTLLADDGKSAERVTRMILSHL